MRTTVTLDADTEQMVRELMAERGISFKRAVNDAIREGASRRPRRRRFVTRPLDLGVPAVDLDRALQLASALEDDDLVRRMRRGA